MTGEELIRLFLGFFQDRGHKIIPSSSLVPHRDPSLLLTSAGMVPLKPYYLGTETPPGPRMASCQKCFRTTDIDSVGDRHHLTFFEMLGNFSIGDYFKEESISWAWEFVTGHLKLPEGRLWPTIYLDDEEAFGYWRQIGIPAEKILRFGEEDNFWGPVGDAGPCGPCSEIHYDLGEEFGCGKPDCQPNCDCGRFCEIWNLVFVQFNQDKSGQRSRLPAPSIDTGMGLERATAAVQGRGSPYETDLFAALVDSVCRLSGKEHGRDVDTDRSIRTVVEHSRGIPFLIADGVMPAGDGRGYILRRIVRRASLFGRRLGLYGPFLNETVGVVVATMGERYPELPANRSLISEVIRAEEERFIATLDGGLNHVERAIDEALAQERDKLTGAEVFRLYDQRGVPPEVTAEIAAEKGLSVDREGFQFEMERQRERGRADTQVSLGGKAGTGTMDSLKLGQCTRFLGYETVACRGRVQALMVREQPVQTASRGEEVLIGLDETPFYGEMGGQAGDHGEIIGPKGRVIVRYTSRTAAGVTVHHGEVLEGEISVADEVEARVDVERRLDIARNHTATHLLHAALRKTLGGGVYQRGSLVEADRFRFDFSHPASISEEQLKRIQRHVNEWIRDDLNAEAKVVPYSQAIADGAIALFEEKYGEEVRVLEIGEPAISRELCGGTHVRATGEIGLFLVTGESSIGVGLHRIEAVTGRHAESLVESRLAALQSVAGEVEGAPEEAPDRVRALSRELEGERKRALSLERELSRRMAEDLAGRAEQVGDVTVLTARVPSLSMPVLREMGDMLRDRLKSGVIVLATVHDGKPGFLAMVTPDLTARGFHAGEIIGRVARATGGGGGGKAAMAQAGGRDAARVDEALTLVREIVAGKGS